MASIDPPIYALHETRCRPGGHTCLSLVSFPSQVYVTTSRSLPLTTKNQEKAQLTIRESYLNRSSSR